jgi:hypothetical protein
LRPPLTARSFSSTVRATASRCPGSARTMKAAPPS